ncbi:MAG TPA: hypothetical protein VFJ19_09850 [Nocardioidaceae bacterium]|nr:hypothetical protein [Nocardioidaceae bacterium]
MSKGHIRLASGAEESEPTRPTYRVASYTVYPTGYERITDPKKSRWCLTVADAGDGWAIRRARVCLNYANQWEYEPPPSLRDAKFRRRCRYNEHAALLRARQLIDKLRVADLTFDEFVDEVLAEARAQALAHLEGRNESPWRWKPGERLKTLINRH